MGWSSEARVSKLDAPGEWGIQEKPGSTKVLRLKRHGERRRRLQHCGERDQAEVCRPFCRRFCRPFLEGLGSLLVPDRSQKVLAQESPARQAEGGGWMDWEGQG